MEQGACSICKKIDDRKVLKTYKEPFISYGLLQNEIKWYKLFSRDQYLPSHIPKMFDYSEDSLILEYAGTPITKEIIPADFRKQLRKIALYLKAHRCCHCDISPSNLLILEKKVFLIDFGWAVKIGQNPYQVWKDVYKIVLDNIGGPYRAKDWPNDNYSFNRVIKEFQPGFLTLLGKEKSNYWR